MPSAVITVRPHRGNWQVYECDGVQPVYRSFEQALSYARERIRGRKGTWP